MKLLIIEDEPELASGMVSYLRQESYTCDLATGFQEALARTEGWDYDCIILDITLPDGSGLQVLQELRKNHKTDGVIIISARNSIDDRIHGLKLGADDYLIKPFHLSELAARVAAIIRRKMYDGNNIISFQEIQIDTMANEVSVHNIPVGLTGKEYQLLLYLIANKGKVIPKNAILDHLWIEEMGYGGSFDFIYTHIKNLRKKLQQQGCGDYIKSVYGIGYKLTDK
ncbi:MAG TPA: response regulator transcription factor [Chitinophagaceae bacterium]|jgi:DNA-binding response OmpR family regulator|nr:response regulator transcription factor [Chitinophagaceae bacterium]